MNMSSSPDVDDTDRVGLEAGVADWNPVVCDYYQCSPIVLNICVKLSHFSRRRKKYKKLTQREFQTDNDHYVN